MLQSVLHSLAHVQLLTLTVCLYNDFLILPTLADSFRLFFGIQINVKSNS